jgi:hypothetical protein
MDQLLAVNRSQKAFELFRVWENNEGKADIQDPETKVKVQRLILPGEIEYDSFPQIEAWIQAPLHITAEMLENALSTLPRCCASGMNGWSYDLVVQLATKAGHASARFSEELLNVFNLILHGRGGPLGVWTRPRLVPLTKPNSDGVRPICIGDVLVRILSRIAASVTSKKLHKYFLPLQFSISEPDGVGTIVHGVSLVGQAMRIKDPDRIFDLCIQTLDIKNAFNSVHRAAIYKEVKAQCPTLLPYLRWFYRNPIDLYCGNGTLAASAGSGVLQGDPLGGLFFALAMQPVLLKVQEQFPEVGIWAYADDVTMTGRYDEVMAAKAMFTKECSYIGLILNEAKSCLYHPTQGTRPREHGIHILGSLIGADDAHFTQFVEATLHDTLKHVPGLAELDPRQGLPILKSCVNAQPTHLARTHPEVPYAQDFDNAIDKALVRMAGLAPVVDVADLPSHLANLRMRPVSEGGMGMPRLEVIRKPAYAASFTHAMHTIVAYRPQDAAGFKSLSIHGAFNYFMGKAAERAEPYYYHTEHETYLPRAWTTIETYEYDPTAKPKDSPTQRQLTEQYIKSVGFPVQFKGHAHGALLERQCMAQMYSNSYVGGGDWLMPWRYPTLKPSRATFISNLRLRLLLQTIDTSVPGVVTDEPVAQCANCKKVLNASATYDATMDPIFHALSCRGLSNERTYRHDNVVDELTTTLQKLFGAPNVKHEPVVTKGKNRGDVLLTVHDRRYCLDVAICNAASATNVSRNKSDEKPGAAAEAMEAMKEAWYQHILSPQERKRTTVVPFVFEASGKLGLKASKFVEEMLSGGFCTYSDKMSTWKFGMAHMRFHIHRGNSAAIHKFNAACTFLNKVNYVVEDEVEHDLI